MAGTDRSKKDKEMAARMKREGVCRTIQLCPNCYRIIACESWKSRYTHVCKH